MFTWWFDMLIVLIVLILLSMLKSLIRSHSSYCQCWSVLSLCVNFQAHCFMAPFCSSWLINVDSSFFCRLCNKSDRVHLGWTGGEASNPYLQNLLRITRSICKLSSIQTASVYKVQQDYASIKSNLKVFLWQCSGSRYLNLKTQTDLIR